MIRHGILFSITMAVAVGCGAPQSTGGSGSGGSGSVECGTVMCNAPASCVAVVGMSPEDTKHECVLKCTDDTICATQIPKGQTCQNIHEIGKICQLADD
jgi:hypothetical protein